MDRDEQIARLEASVTRLAQELAAERQDHYETKLQLLSARRQVRVWRRVAEWIHNARPKGDK